MSNLIMKELIALQFKILDAVTELLPERIKGGLKNIEKVVIESVHDAAKDYLEKKTDEKEKDDSMKSVKID